MTRLLLLVAVVMGAVGCKDYDAYERKAQDICPSSLATLPDCDVSFFCKFTDEDMKTCHAFAERVRQADARRMRACAKRCLPYVATPHMGSACICDTTREIRQ